MRACVWVHHSFLVHSLNHCPDVRGGYTPRWGCKDERGPANVGPPLPSPTEGLWISGCLWICGSVDLWICGSVDLWICGSLDGLQAPCVSQEQERHTHQSKANRTRPNSSSQCFIITTQHQTTTTPNHNNTKPHNTTPIQAYPVVSYPK